MQPRPRMPFNGGMGQQMFGGGRPMMGPGGYNPMMNRPPAGPFGGGNPMMGARMGARPMNQTGGGLLSKLLGRGTQPGTTGGGMMGVNRAAGSGGLLQTLSNPGGLNGILNNTQQVLKTAQSIGPVTQQYGPMVKNLPAMWKLYRGIKNATKNTDSSSKETKAEAVVDESSTMESTESSHSKHQTTSSRGKKERTNNNQKGSSMPKMYI